MATSVTKAPTSASNYDRGYSDWTNPANVLTSNNAYAVSPASASDYLYCSGFNFSIPTDAIKFADNTYHAIITIEGYAASATNIGCLLLNNLTYLCNPQTIGVGTTEQNYSTIEFPFYSSVTVSDINSANFNCIFYTVTPYSNTYIDYVTVTVKYILPDTKTATDYISSTTENIVKAKIYETSDLISSVTETATQTDAQYNINVAYNNRAFLYNVNTNYWTYQDNAPFTNGIYLPTNNKILTARRDMGQISLIDGNSFDGTNISSVIKTGYLNFGRFDEVKIETRENQAQDSEAIKKLRAFFAEVKSEGDLTLTVYTENGEKTFTIPVTNADNTTLNIIRICLSRDIRGKYICFKITNSEGKDFWLGEMRVKAMSREIR